MGKKKHLMGPAASRIGRMVADKLNAGDFVGGAARTVRKSSDEIVAKVRRVSKRRKYLGNTPGKSSRTGREVIQRMKDNGEIVTINGRDFLLWKEPGTNITRRVDLADTDMGHYPVDAVQYWNETGITHGARSPDVREWMLNPDHYRIQPSAFNRSEGAKSGLRYNDPTP